MQNVLRMYPALEKVYSSSSSRAPLDSCYIGTLLKAKQDEDCDFGLADVNTVVAGLLNRFPQNELAEQLDELFVGTDLISSENKWMKAYAELLAFFHFHNNGCLHSLGWPTGSCTTPPFDLQLNVNSVIIPSDIKQASGSGVDLLREELHRIAADWQVRHQLPQSTLSIRYLGTVTQQEIGPAVRGGALSNSFEQALNALNALPDSPIILKDGDLQIEVTFADDNDVGMTAGTQSAKGIIDSLSPTLQKHVSGKAASSMKHGAPPFLLVYVLAPGKGQTDMRSQNIIVDLVKNVSKLSQLTSQEKSLWLGVMFLDFCRGTITSPIVSLVARTGANWPQGLVAAQMAQVAKGTVIDV